MFHLANKCTEKLKTEEKKADVTEKLKKEEKKADVALYSANNIPVFFTCSEDVDRKVGWSPSYKKINQPQLEEKEGAETDGMEDLKEVVMLLIGNRIGLQQNESDDFEALIDSACPRTVSGIDL